MKEYLIRIENERGSNCTTISGDCPARPFQIANNLWNYTTPWHAAQRLEKLAKSWEGLGLNVRRVYGTVWDMPTAGDERNVDLIRLDYGWIELE
jgi:hypothetical protein